MNTPLYISKLYSIRRFLIVLMACFPLSSCTSQETGTEILWDNFGVPHITGKSSRDMYFAYGWTQMEMHADLILKLYGQARGRASEYWGEEYFESDKKVTLFEIPQHAAQNLQKMDNPYRSYVEAFSQGVNAFAEAHPAQVNEKVRVVLPVGPEDVIAHVLRILCLEFIAGDELNAVRQAMGNGSNALALAPSRSDSGHSMLITNPHLPWYDFFLWFEAHLKSEDFNAYGISLVGVPTLSMAFNNRLGWAFTVNTMDGADRYRLQLEPGGYRWDESIKAFGEKEHQIRVLQKDGSLKEVVMKYQYSVHGPVVAGNESEAWAVRLVGMENHRVFEQYHRMAAADNLSEFESALKLMQNPMFNILYADADGNIMYLFNGNIPKRNKGDFGFWRGAVDGTKSGYLWSGIHAYEDLPRVVNPESGFLQNCNDAPWVCTYPPVLNPTDYPPYMAPQTMMLRAQRAVNMIKDSNQVSFEQLVDYKLNTGVEAADRFLDELLRAVELHPSADALEASAVLKAWDRKTDADSRGAILFTAWFDLLRHTMFLNPWDPANPVTTPNGFKDPAEAAELLAKAVRDTRKKYGSLDVPWGEVHRLRMNGYDFPASGGPGEYGIYRTMGFMDDHDGKKRAVFGDTYVALITFSNPPKAKVLLGYGNASQEGNPHRGDQLRLMSQKELRPALLQRKDILENLEKREIIDMVPEKSGGVE